MIKDFETILQRVFILGAIFAVGGWITWMAGTRPPSDNNVASWGITFCIGGIAILISVLMATFITGIGKS